MNHRILMLNGPNLNLLGVREPEIYGSTTLAAIEQSCREFAELIHVELDFRQSNHEGVLVDWIQEARSSADAIVINPAGFSFYSVAMLDAIRMFEGPVVELHLSNIHGRDEVHRHSIFSAVATAVIYGLGAYGYIVALQAASRLLAPLSGDLPSCLKTGPQ